MGRPQRWFGKKFEAEALDAGLDGARGAIAPRLRPPEPRRPPKGPPRRRDCASRTGLRHSSSVKPIFSVT